MATGAMLQLPLQISGQWYVWESGELLPAIYGGAEGAGGPGADDGDGTETTPATPDLPTILAAVNKEVGRVVRTSLKPIHDRLSTFDTWRQEFDARFQQQGDTETGTTTESGETPTTTTAVGDDNKKAEGALRKQLRELTETVGRLTTENKEAQQRTAEMMHKERNTNRDRLLADSLNSLGVVSLDGGIKFFRDDLAYDEDADEWAYATRDGARYTIPEMVAKFTPEWLKKPLATGGGSGGGRPQGAAAQRAEIARIRALQEEAGKTGTQAATMAFWRARKEALSKGMKPEELESAI